MRERVHAWGSRTTRRWILRESEAPRKTRGLEESLAKRVEEGHVSRLTNLQRAFLDEGRTVSRLQPLVTHAEVAALEEQYGMGEKARGWRAKPGSVAERLDDLATWLLSTDQAAQGLDYQMKSDIITSNSYVRIRKYEYIVAPESVEWYWTTQGANVSWEHRQHGVRDGFRSAYATYRQRLEMERAQDMRRATVQVYVLKRASRQP